MERDEVSFLKQGSVLKASLLCELDHHAVGRIRRRIDEEVFYHSPKTLVLDFSAVGFMDSSGIALILGRVEVAAAVGATVRLFGLSPSLMKLVRLSGVDRVRGVVIGSDSGV